MVQKFLNAVRTDPRAKELEEAMAAPKSDKEAIEGYLKLAKDLGFDMTADELIAGLKGLEQNQKAQTDKIALDTEDLENVAGGNETCIDTHVEGEWCWFTDSCEHLITNYLDIAPNEAKEELTPYDPDACIFTNDLPEWNLITEQE